ncbi:MAG: aldo/keto reductase [Burkholderiales bacterium]|nr:aldo/keto reductase [Anaerolineae bacterium]
MRTIVIPTTNLKVSQICLGAVNFGAPLSQAESFRLMDEFVDKGGNFLDTARVYAEWLPGGANASESTIGAWMQRRGNRNKMIVATKGGHPNLSTMNQSRLNPDDIRQDIEASLKFLETDVIDVYWLHRDDTSQPVGSILEMMNEHIRLGNIRCVGCSNWTVDRIRAASTYAAQHHLSDFVANQFMWSIAEPNREAIADKTIVIANGSDLAYHRETRLPVMPYTAQGKGYFSKLAMGEPQHANKRVYDNAINRSRFIRIQELSRRHNVSISAVVLGYLTSQPFPVIPIISASTPEQLEDSLTSSKFVLSPEELAFLEAL